MKGYKTNDIKDHNIKNEDIKEILKVEFNGSYKGRFTYAISGMKLLASNKKIIDMIQDVLNHCENDKILEINNKSFFTVGIAIKNEGFTLCLASDQTADIFNIYEEHFNNITDLASLLFQVDHKQYMAEN